MMSVIYVMIGITAAAASYVGVSAYYEDRFSEKLKMTILLPVLVVLCGCVSGAAYSGYGYMPVEAALKLCLVTMLIMIGAVDLKQKIVPNKLLVLLAVLKITALPVECVFEGMSFPERIWQCFAGMLAGSSIFLAASLIGKGCVGMGDVKLFGVVGMYLGLRYVLPVMELALILGLVKGVCGLITKRLKPHDSFSFAPQIAAACVMVLLAG